MGISWLRLMPENRQEPPETLLSSVMIFDFVDNVSWSVKEASNKTFRLYYHRPTVKKGGNQQNAEPILETMLQYP